MATRSPPGWAWALGALLLAGAGSAFIVQAQVAQRRAAFDTDARIAHRLLSQVAAQHDAMLATLTLLQPAAADSRRVPALAPQVLRLTRRGPGEAWPGDGAEAMAQAEAESARRGRAVIAAAELAQGRYTLLRAGDPAAFALALDLAAVVPWPDWPLPRSGAARAVLRLGGVEWVIHPGADTHARWQMSASKLLAAESQPLDLVITRPLLLRELPWGWVAAWCALCAALAAAGAAVTRQREATRRAQALLRLGQAGRLNALGELAAGMAHELNQPLTAVLAGTQAAQRLLDDSEPDLPTARAALARSAQQARRAADVVARLRRLVQPPDPEAAPQRLPLAAAVAAVLDLLQPQLQAAGVVVDTSALDGSAVTADPVALEQVLHNLVQNALQAIARGGSAARRLGFASRRNGSLVELQIHDSGPGFAPEALEHAFEPFFTTREGGLGLGLSLCETLAMGMGGRLAAANHERGGALLTLTLPAA
jgi:signal transduction histidine kinase